MWKFLKYEWRYWLTSPMTWILFSIVTLLVFGAVSSDNISIGGGVGSVHKNAPSVIQTYYGVMSLVCLLMTTAFMNATANRDFQYQTYQLIFSAPIKKSHYFFGKFFGAYVMCIIPLLGVSVGSLLGPLMPWVQPERYGPVLLDGHLWGILGFALPNIFISGVLLFSLAIIFRNNIVSFVGSMVILVFYLVSSGFTRDIQNEWLANILDPFGFRPQGLLSKYATVDERNLHATALTGPFLMNRLLWMGIAAVLLVVLYSRFSFQERNKKPSSKKQAKAEIAWLPTSKVFIPTVASKFSWKLLRSLIGFELKTVVRNPTFIIICVIGAINLIANLTSFTGAYGDKQYPVTYTVIDSIRGAFYIYLIAIITFYSGVLVWKERDAKMNEIQDATPIKTGMLFSSKFIAMVLTVALILALTIVIGVVVQTCFGFHDYHLDVYLTSLLGFDVMEFSYLIVIALFFHYLINNRYIAYFAFIAFVIVNSFVWGALQIQTNMVQFGAIPSIIYSDMNGFGPFLTSALWFNVYWFLASVLILFVVFAFYTRGKEMNFGKRWKDARLALGRNLAVIGVVLVLFLACSGFVYYNTQVLNTYDNPKEGERKLVAYEQKYKQYEGDAQPRFYRFNYNIDLDPYQRIMDVHVNAWAQNRTNQPIKRLYLNVPDLADSFTIIIAGTKTITNDKQVNFRIMELDKPLAPGDSLQMTVAFKRMDKGFENQVSFTKVTSNGSFFNNQDIMPTLGYNRDYEMSDKNKRVEYKLPKRIVMPRLNEQNLTDRKNTYIAIDADWVDVNTIISTAPDQIAVAPGSLVKSWEANGKRYFNYHLDRQSLNFYSFISARYEVARQKWNGVDIEVYYDRAHKYNVPNMLKGVENALKYYTANFGPYAHKECRILEFPRYASFAQSFPGTMPYSEGIGFITDLRNATKDDIDFVYYVVAHEMGHQYWAHQLCGANMQGSEMMSEGFAQYSALMVMEKEYGKAKMKKFLKYEMDGYLSGRSREFQAERPLYKTEGQQYIHYQKASVVMYYLKEMIGEDKVNSALRSLIDTYAYKNPPYATSQSAIRAFRAVTPDTLQYLIDDMFENITVFSNRITEVKSTKTSTGYDVTIKTKSEKFRCDSLGKETAVPVKDFIDVGLFAESKNKKDVGSPIALQRIHIHNKENTFTFHTKEKPYQAGIDPYNYLVDRIPDDNLKKLE